MTKANQSRTCSVCHRGLGESDEWIRTDRSIVGYQVPGLPANWTVCIPCFQGADKTLRDAAYDGAKRGDGHDCWRYLEPSDPRIAPYNCRVCGQLIGNH